MMPSQSAPRCNAISRFPLPGWALGALAVALLACDGGLPSPKTPLEVETHTQALAVQSAPEAVEKKAEARAETIRRVDALKRRLAELPGDEDNAERKAVMRELRAALDTEHSQVPGAGGAVPGAQGRAAPSIAPERYQRLRSKMANFDMSKPADVAAWAELKRKELGQ
jgi:hypothetical protein